MSDQEPKNPQKPPFRRLFPLKTGLALIILLGASVGTVFLFSGRPNPKKPPAVQNPIRPKAYYGLVFHLRDLGGAVYQATGDKSRCPGRGCKPDNRALKSWFEQTQTLLADLSNDPALPNQCQDRIPLAKRTLSKEVKKLDAPRSSYGAGYLAGKEISLLLSICSQSS